MNLSPHEIADLAIKAGFSKTTIVPDTKDSEAVVAVAVFLAESGGNPDQISRTTANITSDPKSVGNRDHGLTQLSGRWQYPKIQAAEGKWRDPAVNIGIAYNIFTGAGRKFTPWAAFTGKNDKGVAPYEQYLPDARLAVAQPWPYTDMNLEALNKLSASVAKMNVTMVEFARKVDELSKVVAELRKHFS